MAISRRQAKRNQLFGGQTIDFATSRRPLKTPWLNPKRLMILRKPHVKRQLFEEVAGGSGVRAVSRRQTEQNQLFGARARLDWLLGLRAGLGGLV